MRKCLFACTVAAALVAITSGLHAAQAASIPLTIGVTASPIDVASGDLVSVALRLKNYRGEPVAAPDDVTLTVHSELSGDATVVIKAGQSDGQAGVRFHRPGVATLVATAPNLGSGSASIVVRPSETAAAAGAPAVAAPAAAGSTAAPRPAAPARSDSAASSSKINLAVDVLPQHVHPTNSSWQAKVLVTAIDDNRRPIAVPADTGIQLATDVGIVMPGSATIAAGHARTTEQILLTSSKPGDGTLWAWTDAGELGHAAFEDHEAVPVQLAVRALPMRTLNDGRTEIHVSVFLQDDTSIATKTDDELQVKLTSSVGTLNPSILAIPKGGFVGESILTSATAGSAEITATAAGLRPGVSTVTFVFPYALVLMAAIGGLVGALVRSTDVTITGTWWSQLLGSLAIGSVLGLVFYLLAMFGIVASIPTLAIPLAQLPTTNEFAALVLGFFGGYFARAWLPTPDGETAAEPRPADHPAV